MGFCGNISERAYLLGRDFVRGELLECVMLFGGLWTLRCKMREECCAFMEMGGVCSRSGKRDYELNIYIYI